MNFLSAQEFPVSLYALSDTKRITHEIKLDIFRFCQDTLENFVNFSEASNVKLGVETIGEKITISIMDRGQGIDISQKLRSTHLASMKKRATSVNGLIQFSNKAGKGTLITFTIPALAAYGKMDRMA